MSKLQSNVCIIKTIFIFIIIFFFHIILIVSFYIFVNPCILLCECLYAFILNKCFASTAYMNININTTQYSFISISTFHFSLHKKLYSLLEVNDIDQKSTKLCLAKILKYIIN